MCPPTAPLPSSNAAAASPGWATASTPAACFRTRASHPWCPGAPSDRAGAPAQRTVVIDVGGGSTELIVGSGRAVEFSVSLQAGVVRQSERHLPGDPPTGGELEPLPAPAGAP